MATQTSTWRIQRVLDFVQVWMSHLTISLTVGSLVLQVVSRQFGWQVDWTEELARFSFLVMVFAGASYASGKASHLRVSVFSDLASRWRWSGVIVRGLQWAAVIAFDSLFCVFAVMNVVEGLRYPNISPSLGFNESLLFLAPAAFFAIAVVQRLLRMYDPMPQSMTGSLT
ncbi:MAG: TRAP transporter small permease [Rubrivivax sp.]|jgi:TRAP-type C4-dicarboxylate transport system permease small subunit